MNRNDAIYCIALEIKSNSEQAQIEHKICFITTILIHTIFWKSNTMSRFNLIYIPKYNAIFLKEHNLILDETKYYDKILQVSVWGNNKNQMFMKEISF